jgi:Holliday junction resolvasome RuvABC endonuclease subunit
MRILGIDPGPEQSAWLLLDSAGGLDLGRVVDFGQWETERVRQLCRVLGETWVSDRQGGTERAAVDLVAIEWIESYGMTVGREVFETVHWAGRMTEAVAAQDIPVVQVPRRAVKIAICGDTRAKDANIHAALLERWGGKARAVGSKAAPGPLYGISKDVWSALAIAVTEAQSKRVVA